MPPVQSKCRLTGFSLFVVTALRTDSIHSRRTCDTVQVHYDDMQPEEKEELDNGRVAMNVLMSHIALCLWLTGVEQLKVCP